MKDAVKQSLGGSHDARFEFGVNNRLKGSFDPQVVSLLSERRFQLRRACRLLNLSYGPRDERMQPAVSYPMSITRSHQILRLPTS